LSIAGTLTALRTLTFPDRSLTMRGVSGTQTNNRLSKFDANGDSTDSLIQDGVATGALTIAKTGTTARTATFPDAAVQVTGSASALTNNRLPKGTTTAGVEADSQIADAVTGNVLSIAGTLTAPRTITLPDRALTIRGVSGTQTTARLNKFDANGDQQDSQIADGVTGNVLTIAGTLTAPRTHTVQDKAGTIALTETSDRHGFKNLLHNGRVLVDQRATLTTPINVPTGAFTYGPDGWTAYKGNATHVITIGKVAVVNTPMVGSLSACKLNITTGAALASGEATTIQRFIEGTIFSRCNFGTAQAATLYYSFWAEASVTGTISVSFRNGAAARSYVVNHTITATNTRQLFQGSIVGDTTGTWPTDTTAALQFAICLGAGSSLQTTAGSWQAGNFLGTSSTTNFASAANSVQISDLYLGTEPIGTATSDYPHVPFDVELQRSKRYYQLLRNWAGFFDSATSIAGTFRFYGEMRVSPTIVPLTGNTLTWRSPGTDNSSTTWTSLATSATVTEAWELFGNVSGTSGSATGNRVNSTTNLLSASAEL
jgi:hypothetical protein